MHQNSLNQVHALIFELIQGFNFLFLFEFKLKIKKFFLKKSRKEAEKDLVFKGLLVMENKIKPETFPSIKALKAASFRNVMVTGYFLKF